MLRDGKPLRFVAQKVGVGKSTVERFGKKDCRNCKLSKDGRPRLILVIYLVNQLFIVNNDVIELGWLEPEFYSTDRSQFGGVLFKVRKKSISPGLIDFQEGSMTKSHIKKIQKTLKSCIMV